jgi:diguanylate cyclase (GGDEF)-like protein/PAS domain S-box-containing protein
MSAQRIGTWIRQATATRIAMVFAAASVLWFGLTLGSWPGETTQALITTGGVATLRLIVAWLCWLGARAADDLGERRFFRLSAVAHALYAAGDYAWAYLENVQNIDPTYSFVNVFYFSFYPLIALAMFMLPRRYSSAAHRVHFWLDSAAATVAATAVVGLLLAERVSEELTPSVDAWHVFVTVAVPVCDVITVIAAAAATMRLPLGVARQGMLFLAAALVLNLLADLMWLTLALFGQYDTGGWPDYLWYFSTWCFLIGSLRLLQAWPERRERHAVWTDNAQLVPGIAAGTLLLAAAMSDSVANQRLLLIGVLALTVLAAARQWLVQRENADLLADLSERRTDARLTTLIERSPDATLLLDGHGRVTYASPAVRTLIGVGVDGLLGRDLGDCIAPDNRDIVEHDLASVLSRHERERSSTWRLSHPDGRVRRAEVQLTDLRAEPEVHGVVLSLRDVSERHELAEQLQRQALYDPLTGLSRRSLFRDQLDQALGARGRGALDLALVLVNIDEFTHINDSLGHAAGDQLLRLAAERLKAAAPEAPAMARLAGDEFALLLHVDGAGTEALALADRLRLMLARPFAIDGRELQVATSIGVAFARAEERVGGFMACAEAALHEAKRQGGGRVCVFDRAMERDLRRKLDILAQLRRAMVREELAVAYQPLIASADLSVFGVEALLRCPGWQQPLPISEVIAQAEQSGLIVELGAWVLRRSLHDLAPVLRDSRRTFTLTVNMSWRQLDDPNVLATVADALATADVAPERLILELTETGEPAAERAHLETIEALRSLGVRFALDDFGTGLSSFSTLNDLPMDILKLPKSTIDVLANPQQDAPMVDALLALSKRLNMVSIAEGVETAQQVEALRRRGCDVLQGFYFAEPMSSAALHDWLTRRATPA